MWFVRSLAQDKTYEHASEVRSMYATTESSTVSILQKVHDLLIQFTFQKGLNEPEREEVPQYF